MRHTQFILQFLTESLFSDSLRGSGEAAKGVRNPLGPRPAEPRRERHGAGVDPLHGRRAAEDHEALLTHLRFGRIVVPEIEPPVRSVNLVLTQHG